MGKLIILILALGSAAIAAMVFGTVAHDDLGMSIETIRNQALVSAGFMSVAVACQSLLSRKK